MMKVSRLFFAGASALIAFLLSSCGPAPSAPALSRLGRAAEPPRNIVIVEGGAPEGAAAAPSSAAAPETAPETAAATAPSPAPGAFLRRSLPEGAGSRSERLAALLLELAADPEIEAIVLAPAPKGAAEAFRLCREAKPGLLLIAAEPEEDALLIQSSADLVALLRDPGQAGAAALAEGLAELARRAVRKGARLDGLEDLLASLRAADPGLRWSASYFVDPATGLRARNQVVVEGVPKE